MATTRDDIQTWWCERPKTTTHMIVVCDTYDHEDYPVYVTQGQDVHEKLAEHSKDMQRVMEVYSAALPFEAQLREHRAYHLDVLEAK
jgi:thiaminase